MASTRHALLFLGIAAILAQLLLPLAHAEEIGRGAARTSALAATATPSAGATLGPGDGAGGPARHDPATCARCHVASEGRTALRQACDAPAALALPARVLAVLPAAVPVASPLRHAAPPRAPPALSRPVV